MTTAARADGTNGDGRGAGGVAAADGRSLGTPRLPGSPPRPEVLAAVIAEGRRRLRRGALCAFAVLAAGAAGVAGAAAA